MLVVSRKSKQKIIIGCPDGKEIEIMFVRNNGKAAEIGVAAPDDYSILRSELLDTSKDERACEIQNLSAR